jgi:hypothetical protein
MEFRRPGKVFATELGLLMDFECSFLQEKIFPKRFVAVFVIKSLRLDPNPDSAKQPDGKNVCCHKKSENWPESGLRKQTDEKNALCHKYKSGERPSSSVV